MALRISDEWRWFVALAIGWICLGPQSGIAAQDARVVSEQAAIRERPLPEAKIIESAPQGAVLRVSSRSKEGWFKTKSSLGIFGWIWQGDLVLENHQTDLRATGLEIDDAKRPSRFVRDEPRYFVRAGGNLIGMFAPQFSLLMGLSQERIYFGTGGMVEGLYLIKPGFRASLRYQFFRNVTEVTTQGIPYEVTHFGSAIMAGLEADVSTGESFDISAALRLGLSPSNSLRVGVPLVREPNSFEVSRVWPAVLVSAVARYTLSSWISLFGELGAYYSEVPTSSVPNTFNGDDVFRQAPGSNEALKSVRVSHAGPIFFLGLMLGF